MAPFRSQALVLSKVEKSEILFPQELTQNSDTTHDRKKIRRENSKSKPLPQANEPGGRNEGSHDKLHSHIDLCKMHVIFLAYNLLC